MTFIHYTAYICAYNIQSSLGKRLAVTIIGNYILNVHVTVAWVQLYLTVGQVKWVFILKDISYRYSINLR